MPFRHNPPSAVDIARASIRYQDAMGNIDM